MEATDKSPPAVNGGHITYAEAQIQSLAKFPEENPSPVLRVDKDGAVLYANPPGKAILEAWGASVGRAVPNDWRKVIKEVLASGHTAVREMQVQDRILSLTLAPITASGYVNLYGRDVTKQKLTDAILRESEERFRALLAASSDVLYRMNADWSEMYHLSGGGFLADTEMPDRDWLAKYIHPEDQTNVLSVIREAIRTKHTFELEHRVLCDDGSIGWTFSRAIPMLNENGEIFEWFGAASDITEHKQAEASLRESYEDLARFNRLAVDREMRMIELKNEINALAQTGCRRAMRWTPGRTPVIAANGSRDAEFI